MILAGIIALCFACTSQPTTPQQAIHYKVNDDNWNLNYNACFDIAMQKQRAFKDAGFDAKIYEWVRLGPGYDHYFLCDDNWCYDQPNQPMQFGSFDHASIKDVERIYPGMRRL